VLKKYVFLINMFGGIKLSQYLLKNAATNLIGFQNL